MNKKGRWNILFLLVLALVLYAFIVIAPTWQTRTQTAWNEGTFNYTQSNSSNSLELSGFNGTEYNNTLSDIVPNSTALLVYHFNNDSGKGENMSNIYDWTGRGNNGTILNPQNNATWNASGWINGSMSFDGVDDFVEIPDPFGDQDHTISISGWYKANPNGGGDGAFARGADGFGSGWSMNLGVIPNNFPYFSVVTLSGGTAQYSVFGKTNITANRWYHIVAVYGDGSSNNKNLSIYVDGQLGDSSANLTAVLRSSTVGFRLGHVNQALYWNGSIDEFAIWNRTLNSSEVQNLYDLQRSKFGSYDSKIFDLNSTQQFDNISWLPSFGEIPNPVDEPSLSRRDPNLTLLMHFNNDSAYGENDTRFYDFSGSGNNGSCDMANDRCPRFNESGKFGGAMQWSGTGGPRMVTVSNTGALNSTSNAITIAVWAKRTQTTGISGIERARGIGSQDADVDMFIGCDNNGNNLCTNIQWFAYNLSVGSLFNVQYAPPSTFTSEYTHLAGTFNGSSAFLYINGQLVNSSTTVGNSIKGGFSNSLWCIGTYRCDRPWYNGSMDELAIWNRSLTVQEIGEIYNRTKFGKTYTQVRSCDDSACSGESFVGANGSTNKYFTNNSYSNLTNIVANNRYFQYRLWIDSRESFGFGNWTYFNEINFSYTVVAGNTAPTLTTWILNETNNTFFRSMSINASGNISDVDASDKMNVTDKCYVNNGGWSAVQNFTLNNNYLTGANVSSVCTTGLTNKGSQFRVERSVTDGTATTVQNTTTITINNSNPVWTLANGSVSTSEDSNLVNFNASSFLSDRDNDIITLNHTNININGTYGFSSCSITNSTHLITCNVQPNFWGTAEFNITSTIDNDTTPNIGNTSLKSIKINVTSVNDAPVLVSQDLNVTNATLTFTADFINASVQVTDADLNRTNITVIFYVNNAENITLQGLGDFANGTVFSIVFNNTNITKDQAINVQFNATDGLQLSSYVNTSKVTVGNTAPNNPSTPVLNETNNTLFDNMLINTSAITISDPNAADTLNITFRWYVGNAAVRNTTFNNLVQTATPSDVLPASFVINKGDTIRVEAFAYDGTANNSAFQNSTAITINNSNPVWNLANDAIETTEDNNIASLNISLNLSDRDNNIFTLNHTNIKLNDTLVVSSCSIVNGTHLLSCIANPNGWGYFQFNITSTIDNDTTPNIGNGSLSVRIRVHSIDEAPILSNAAINLTNSSTFRSENINASVDLRDVDLNNTYITAKLFVNNAENITLQLGTWANGTVPSIIFNNTNLTALDVVNVQFNGTDGLTSNYINSTKWTVIDISSDGGSPSMSTNALNLTNSSFITAENINQTITISHPDAGNKTNLTLVLFINGKVNQTVQMPENYLTGSNISYIWNNTNITFLDAVTAQVNGSDGVNASNYLNSTTWTIANFPSAGAIPIVANASLNLTNSSTFTSEFMNFTFNTHHPDIGNTTNFTIVLFINDAVNQTIPMNNNYQIANISYIFNNANITKSQTAVVQVNGSDGQNSSLYINSTKWTIANTAPNNPSTPVLNESNNTLYRSMAINTSAITISDPNAADTLNITFRWYQGSAAVRNTTFNNLAQTATPSDVLPSSLVINKGQAMRVEVWVVSDLLNSSLVNSSAITVNNSAPTTNLSTVGNGTVITSEDNNLVSYNISNSYSDRDNNIGALNHTDIAYNDTNLASAITITNGTHLVSVTVVANATGVIEINATILDNETIPQNGNVTYSFKINITSADDAPYLITASMNITNSSLSTAENINASVTVRDVDLNRTNLTAQLYINNVSNLTFTLYNNYANNSVASIIFNQTNISGGDNVTVQFNGSDGRFVTNHINYTIQISTSADSTAPDVNINTKNLTKVFVPDNLPYFFEINFTANDTGTISSCTFFMDGRQANSSSVITSNVSQLIGNNSFYVKEWKLEVSCIDSASNRGSSGNITFIVERSVQLSGDSGVSVFGNFTPLEEIPEQKEDLIGEVISSGNASVNAFLHAIPYADKVVKNRNFWILFSGLLILPPFMMKRRRLLLIPAALLFILFVQQIYEFLHPIIEPLGKFIYANNPILGFFLLGWYLIAIAPFLNKKKNSIANIILILLATVLLLLERLSPLIKQKILIASASLSPIAQKYSYLFNYYQPLLIGLTAIIIVFAIFQIFQKKFKNIGIEVSILAFIALYGLQYVKSITLDYAARIGIESIRYDFLVFILVLFVYLTYLALSRKLPTSKLLSLYALAYLLLFENTITIIRAVFLQVSSFFGLGLSVFNGVLITVGIVAVIIILSNILMKKNLFNAFNFR